MIWSVSFLFSFHSFGRPLVVPLFRSAFRVGDPVIPRAVGQLSLRYMYVHLFFQFMVFVFRPKTPAETTSVPIYTLTINTRTSVGPASFAKTN
jgi:hypothetical protein